LSAIVCATHSPHVPPVIEQLDWSVPVAPGVSCSVLTCLLTIDVFPSVARSVLPEGVDSASDVGVEVVKGRWAYDLITWTPVVAVVALGAVRVGQPLPQVLCFWLAETSTGLEVLTPLQAVTEIADARAPTPVPNE